MGIRGLRGGRPGRRRGGEGPGPWSTLPSREGLEKGQDSFTFRSTRCQQALDGGGRAPAEAPAGSTVLPEPVAPPGALSHHILLRWAVTVHRGDTNPSQLAISGLRTT